jgi:hypothetical protein
MPSHPGRVWKLYSGISVLPWGCAFTVQQPKIPFLRIQRQQSWYVLACEAATWPVEDGLAGLALADDFRLPVSLAEIRTSRW